MKLTEKEFQAQLLEFARMCGWLCYHTHDSRRSESGFPDLVLVKPPRVIFAELKSETGQPSVPQRRWLVALKRCPGVKAVMWRPSDWPEVETALGRRA